VTNSDKPDSKSIMETIEDMLEERKTKSDRRQQDVPVENDRRSGKDRRDETNSDDSE